MAFFSSKKRYLIVFAGLAATIFFFTTCVSRQAEEIDPVIILPDRNRLVGSASCQSCHSAIYHSFIETAHNKTSEPGLKKYILGSFAKDKNTYVFNKNDGVVMAENDSGLFQANFLNQKLVKAYKIDIVIGSGTRGQTYLTWGGNRLFQLPISYFTQTDSWSNSPGYPEDYAMFTRPIPGKCMGCHGTYINKINSQEKSFDEFDRNRIVYGINCEKCHGAGGKHVDFQSQHPEEKQAKFISNAAKLNQRQQLDACSICHSGISHGMTNPLYFHTGDTNFHKAQDPAGSMSKPDVHGNQYGLLVKSKCFLVSGSITCSNCHNTHQQERGNLAMFSQRCLSCHAPEKGHFCKMEPALGKENLISNCIDCHMPTRESQILNVKVYGEAKHKAAVLRTHQIAIYPDDAKRIQQFMKR